MTRLFARFRSSVTLHYRTDSISAPVLFSIAMNNALLVTCVTHGFPCFGACLGYFIIRRRRYSACLHNSSILLSFESLSIFFTFWKIGIAEPTIILMFSAYSSHGLLIRSKVLDTLNKTNWETFYHVSGLYEVIRIYIVLNFGLIVDLFCP